MVGSRESGWSQRNETLGFVIRESGEYYGVLGVFWEAFVLVPSRSAAVSMEQAVLLSHMKLHQMILSWFKKSTGNVNWLDRFCGMSWNRQCLPSLTLPPNKSKALPEKLKPTNPIYHSFLLSLSPIWTESWRPWIPSFLSETDNIKKWTDFYFRRAWPHRPTLVQYKLISTLRRKRSQSLLLNMFLDHRSLYKTARVQRRERKETTGRRVWEPKLWSCMKRLMSCCS